MARFILEASGSKGGWYRFEVTVSLSALSWLRMLF